MSGYVFTTPETAIKSNNDHSYNRIIEPKYP